MDEAEGDDMTTTPVAWSRGPNLLAPEPPPAAGERFEALAQLGSVVVERIVSSSAPDPSIYDQDQDEWVVLLRGEAELEVAGERVALTGGDTLLIPRHTPHRVLATSAGALWLAVHVHPTKTERGVER